MEYRGVKITLSEFTKQLVVDTSTSSKYEIGSKNGLVFEATSEYGASYATNPTAALDGARRLIDQSGQ